MLLWPFLFPTPRFFPIINQSIRVFYNIDPTQLIYNFYGLWIVCIYQFSDLSQHLYYIYFGSKPTYAPYRWCTTYRWSRCVLGHEQLSVHREQVNKADRAPSICQNQIINLPFIRPMFSYIQRSNLDSRTISEFI